VRKSIVNSSIFNFSIVNLSTVIFSIAIFAITLSVTSATAQNSSASDEGPHVLALDNSWNRALETNDTKALDLLLSDNFVSIDIDGSMQTKREFLASLRVPGYQAPTQSVTEQSKVDVYGTRPSSTESFEHKADRRADL
jgi:hypothetical protein